MSLLLLVGILILFSILINTLRLSGPLGDSFITEIEYQVGQIVGRKVDIGSVEFTVKGFTPTVRVTELSIYRMDEVSPAIEFDEMDITLDTFKTIANIQLTPTHIVLRGSSVEVKRTVAGKLKLSGFDIERSEKASSDENLLDIFSHLTFEAEDIKVFWDDEPLGLSYQFIAQNLNIKKDEESLAMRGTVALPESIGSEVDLAVRLTGNVEDYKYWNGDFYLKTAEVQLPNLPFNLFTKVPYVITSGLAGVEAWGQWVSGDVAVFGDVKLTETIVTQKSGQDQERFYATRLNSLESRFSLTYSQNKWLINADQIKAKISGEEALLNALTVELKTGKQEQVYRGAFDQVSVKTLVSLAQVVQPVHLDLNKTLDQLRPSGTVNNLGLEYHPAKQKQPVSDSGTDTIVVVTDKEDKTRYSVTGNVQDFMINSTGKFPGLQSIDAVIKLSEEGGEARLFSKHMVFDYKHLFYDPIVFDNLLATVGWQLFPGYVDVVIKDLVVANQDGNVNAFGVMRLTGGNDGFMDIEAMSDRLDLLRYQKYLPKILPDKAEKWLKTAFTEGEAENITFSYRGSLNKQAYRKGEAELSAEFSVRDVGVHYQNNWPDVSKAAGLVKFAGRGVSIKIADGVVFKNKIQNGQVSIENFYKPLLNIDLDIFGETRGALAYLKNSPPGKTVKTFLESVKADGQSRLGLSISLPLRKKMAAEYSLQGVVKLDQNTLALADKNLSFEAVSGQFDFTKNTYSADGIQAFFRGKPVTAGVRTLAGKEVRVDVAGRMSLKQLLPDSLLLQEIIKGDSVWKAVTVIPLKPARSGNVSTKKYTSQPKLELTSDLIGSKIDLPAPLAKSQGVKRPIQIDIDTDVTGQNVRFSLDQKFTGQLELLKKAGNIKMTRAVFNFGNEIPALPSVANELANKNTTNQYIEVAGNMKSLDLSAWISRFSELPLKNGSGTSYTNADVHIEDTSFANQTFRNTRVKVANTDAYWRINLSGDDVSGYVRFPQDLANDFKLSAELEHLKLASSTHKGTQDEVIKPSRIPAIDAIVNKFSWNDRLLGRMELETSVNTLGQDINKLTLESDTIDFDVTGNWYEKATGGQLTSLVYRLSGSDIGGFLYDLDITDNLSATEGEITGESSWSGQPFPVDFKSLKGVLHASLQNGRFTQVKSGGFSRFFSAINLDSLPKNMNRNFQDLAGSGYFFDTLDANIEIVNGNVFFNDVDVESASAQLSFNGSTDLVNKQHNLLLGVVPKLSSSVPLAAGLLAGPQTAALVYLLDKIASSAGLDINQTLVLPYEIKGDWENPEIIELFKTDDDLTKEDANQY